MGCQQEGQIHKRTVQKEDRAYKGAGGIQITRHAKLSNLNIMVYSDGICCCCFFVEWLSGKAPLWKQHTLMGGPNSSDRLFKYVCMDLDGENFTPRGQTNNVAINIIAFFA